MKAFHYTKRIPVKYDVDIFVEGGIGKKILERLRKAGGTFPAQFEINGICERISTQNTCPGRSGRKVIKTVKPLKRR